METAPVIPIISGIVALGGFATAIWAILRLNTTVKDKGREEQRIMDKLEFLTKARGEDRETMQSINSELGQVKTIIQNFQKENQKQHHELELRIQKLEIGGGQPARKEK